MLSTLEKRGHNFTYYICIYIYIITLSSSFYLWRWLLTFEFCFIKSSYEHQARFCCILWWPVRTKQDVRFGLSCSFNKSFYPSSVWTLTDLPQVGVFKSQYLWVQTRNVTTFRYNILCILTLVTRKLQVVCWRSTYPMTALLSEMSIFSVRAGCKLRMAS